MRNKRFRGLNYSLSNEDNYVEYHYLREGVSAALAVSCSGAPVIGLLAKSPEHLHCVDISPQQLYLTKLRLEAVKTLGFEEYMMLLGYPPWDQSKDCLKRFRKRFVERASWKDSRCRDFLMMLGEANQWNEFIYTGRWEKFYQRQSSLIRLVLGESAVSKLLKANNLNEQQILLSGEFPTERFRTIIRGLSLLSTIALSVSKSKMPKKNIRESVWSINEKIFNTLLFERYIGDNFYMQLLLRGRLMSASKSIPEADEQIFLKAKEALNSGTEVSYHFTHLMDAIDRCHQKLDYISGSNILSYCSPEMNKNFLESIKPKLNHHAVVLNRHYLYHPDDVCDKDFQNLSDEFSWIGDKDSLPVYTLHGLRKIA